MDLMEELVNLCDCDPGRDFGCDPGRDLDCEPGRDCDCCDERKLDVKLNVRLHDVKDSEDELIRKASRLNFITLSISKLIGLSLLDFEYNCWAA